MPRKAFLVRIDERLWKELRKWADDSFRSLNGQVEFLLRDAVQKHRKQLDTEQEETE